MTNTPSRSARRLLRPILLICFIISACSRDASPEGPASNEEAADGVGIDPSAVEEPAAAQPAAAETTGDVRRVIHTVTLSVRSSDPRGAAERAARTITAAGGYVATQQLDSVDDRVSDVSMVLRVPARQLESALKALRGEGQLLSENWTGDDITSEYTDLQAQLRAKQRLEERLLAILDRTGAIKDALQVEQELGRVRTEIERLQGQQRRFDQLVRYATIEVRWLSPEQPLAARAQSFLSRLDNAVHRATGIAETIVLGMVVVAGGVLPCSIPVLLLGWWMRRARRRAQPA